jgi:hypothetical protein
MTSKSSDWWNGTTAATNLCAPELEDLPAAESLLPLPILRCQHQPQLLINIGRKEARLSRSMPMILISNASNSACGQAPKEGGVQERPPYRASLHVIGWCFPVQQVRSSPINLKNVTGHLFTGCAGCGCPQSTP